MRTTITESDVFVWVMVVIACVLLTLSYMDLLWRPETRLRRGVLLGVVAVMCNFLSVFYLVYSK